MEREIADKERCETYDEEVCGHMSNLCMSCCAWGLCNYGTCKGQNGKLPSDLHSKLNKEKRIQLILKIITTSFFTLCSKVLTGAQIDVILVFEF